MPSQSALLDQLDVLIGLSVILTVTSLLVTLIVQAISSYLALRGTNLRWAVAMLLREFDQSGTLTIANAEAIAAKALSHPLVSGSSLFGDFAGKWLRGFSKRAPDWKLATALRSDELVAILNKLAAEGAVPKEVGATARSFESWFDAMMDRASQRFATQTRAFTVAAAFAVAILLHVDVLAIYTRLDSDPALRASFVAQAAHAGDELARRAAVLPATAGETDAEKDARGRAQAEYRAAVTQWQTTLATLGPLGILPASFGGIFSFRGVSVLGILLGGLLLSLGAPFWFNVLRTLTSLRPLLADKVDEKTRKAS
jgi:hypothetical protein